MKFIDCTYEQVKELKESKNLTLSWRIPVQPKFVEMNDEIVALIDFSFGGVYGSESIEIDHFEVFEKGEATGSKIISAFKEMYKNRIISLYPDNERCKKFWLEHGFVIEPEGAGVERLVYRF
ncbi:hypothetical protein [Bacillus infantis]|uniref:GNAT family N-acetyltransferase n=1 Tax=Bacillus infantis TaxID=324767 RepID=A0A5D4QTF3_9BACI|nr:hypothetical protein [Bacillus infantis]TYS40768.1 hypothetical protein FZD51_24775 [Bacillus infantis]